MKFFIKYEDFFLWGHGWWISTWNERCKTAFQVDAFKDFSPDSDGQETSAASQGGGEGDQEQEVQETDEGDQVEEDGDGDDEAAEETAGGSGGDYPPHVVAGLPALSPTMSQGI